MSGGLAPDGLEDAGWSRDRDELVPIVKLPCASDATMAVACLRRSPHPPSFATQYRTARNRLAAADDVQLTDGSRMSTMNQNEPVTGSNDPSGLYAICARERKYAHWREILRGGGPRRTIMSTTSTL